jgi:hypothetical protein
MIGVDAAFCVFCFTLHLRRMVTVQLLEALAFDLR